MRRTRVTSTQFHAYTRTRALARQRCFMYVRTYYTRHVYTVSCTYGHTVHVCMRVYDAPIFLTELTEVTKGNTIPLLPCKHACAYIDTHTCTCVRMGAPLSVAIITEVVSNIYVHACVCILVHASRAYFALVAY